jgi:hypothetical protein
MLHIFNTQDAKVVARSMEKYVATLGFGMKLGQAMDTLGVMSGFQNWAGLKNWLSETAVNSRLSDVELKHIRESGDEDYGPEYALVAHTGFELRYPAEGELEYVRVCDPLGRETAYWDSDEWAISPQVVMGAMLGALAQRAPVTVGVRKRALQAVAPETGKHSSTAGEPLPRIEEVPFDRVISVEIGPRWYLVTFADQEVLAGLAGPEQDPDTESDAEHQALQIGDDVQTISLATLRGLSWSAAQRCFVDDEGLTYRFNISVPFADILQPAKAPVAAEEKSALTESRPQIYEMRAQRAGQAATMRVVAETETLALSKFHLEFGHENLIEMRVVTDFEAGPFEVVIDGGLYDSVPTLEHAIALAEIMESSAEDEVEIFDNRGELLWNLLVS